MPTPSNQTNRQHRRHPREKQKTSPPSETDCKRRLLVLHGNRQTGQLFLGRLDKLQKRLRKDFCYEFVAPDAPFPHPEDSSLCTWWNRIDNDYQGLPESLERIRQEDKSEISIPIVGILGFSQGARLAHLLSLLHTTSPKDWLPDLRFVILVAGYDAPLPSEFFCVSLAPLDGGLQQVTTPSLHVWGREDSLVTSDQSEAVTKGYMSPQTFVHPGKHYVPTKGSDIQRYVDFIRQVTADCKTSNDGILKGKKQESLAGSNIPHRQEPDEESASMQQEEVQALEAIFPDEFAVRSSRRTEAGFEEVFEHPIIYEMMISPSENDTVQDLTITNWPKHPLILQVTYPHNYPLEVIPQFRLLHENNIYDFPSSRVASVMRILDETATMELGMPSVLSCYYAVRNYLDSPHSNDEPQTQDEVEEDATDEPGQTTAAAIPVAPLIMPSSPIDIQKCNLQGLEIAQRVLTTSKLEEKSSSNLAISSNKKGGSFSKYTIGLVGKPSAGKSTFFNAATAFSRQRGDNDGSPWGGASMAAHPFTTIDPNVGYCLVPAPTGSCPEDYLDPSLRKTYGSTHGRDPEGRRFLPVLLKDVAGLVPGAYQGKGRGNQFLNDLCDANVLIHVVDASGTADAQGNKVTEENSDDLLTDPLEDLVWIRNELVEWVCTNLTAKWNTIILKGRTKLSGMFSGYGQRESVTHHILTALEKYMEDELQRDHALDNMQQWDQGDIHRLVSAFLGARFPIALALNKADLPSSSKFIERIQESFPIHGAHTGVPLAAKQEMTFVKNHLSGKTNEERANVPTGVWQCLTSAMMLREPVLVFPVSDMVTYAPLPGMCQLAVEAPSLPSAGMIQCLKAANGHVPSCWNNGTYAPPHKKVTTKLRDVLMMKPGSTVEDVFLCLKNLKALGGEFVRAEGAGRIGEKPKPVPKHEIISNNKCILKIMSNKRTAWQ